MRVTRRRFLKSAIGAGASLALARSPRWAFAQAQASQAERNKAVVLRYKKAQGTPENAAVAKESLAPDFKRTRAGIQHLANNARDQGFPSPGPNLRDAIPDRVDVIEDIIADGDQVGLLFRITGTHLGNFYGIPPTGKKIDIYEAAIFRLADGKITEAWFMADEAGLLKQLGAKLPLRKDGRMIVPVSANAGEDGDTLLARLAARPAASPEERNKIIVARSKASNPPKGNRAPDYKQRRQGFQLLREHGIATGTAKETPTRAFPDRRDAVDDLLAEGDKVWMQFHLRGTQTEKLYGLPPTGHRVDVAEIGIMRFADGMWKEGWYFGDELGMLLQLGAPDLLAG